MLVSLLLSLDQAHLFEAWDDPGVNDDLKHNFFAQIGRLHRSYPSPGGLADYIKNAKRLLEDARKGENPLNGYTPTVPSGVSLDPLSNEYLEYEKLGMTELGSVGFVLVAGGLGERLGYSGIKVELPVETTTWTSYLEHYCETILALQKRYSNGRKLPLAIMTSDDTYAKTVTLLDKHQYFGMDPSQVVIMKQEKVAALLDNAAHIATVSAYEIESKPHGHGDVHALMLSTGTARNWLDQGIKYVFFFQDTNGLAFFTLAAQLGVSVALELEVNSMSIPRIAKQAVGAITKLVNAADGSSMTINIEYNQLDPLLRATGSADGDVNDPVTGFSPYPGNINQLLFSLEPYMTELYRSHGIMSEFVNPKYADAARSKFKKPTRLECMMQDYPKTLGPTAKVGFTMAPAWICFSPCKNNTVDAAAAVAGGIPANSAFTAESDQYYVFSELLRRIGATVPSAAAISIRGISAIPAPRIVIKPSTAVFASELLSVFPSPSKLNMTSSSTLIIDGDVVVKTLVLDGALKLCAGAGARLAVRAGLKQGGVRNSGQQLVLFDSSGKVASDSEQKSQEKSTEVDEMRGYVLSFKKLDSVDASSIATASTAAAGAADLQISVFNGRILIPSSAYDDDEDEMEDAAPPCNSCLPTSTLC
jgi:UDP-sugar pyrophosphorylase